MITIFKLRKCTHANFLPIIWGMSKREGKVCLDCGSYTQGNHTWESWKPDIWLAPWLWRKNKA